MADVWGAMSSQWDGTVSACCLQDVVRVCVSEASTMMCLGHNYTAVR